MKKAILPYLFIAAVVTFEAHGLFGPTVAKWVVAVLTFTLIALAAFVVYGQRRIKKAANLIAEMQ